MKMKKLLIVRLVLLVFFQFFIFPVCDNIMCILTITKLHSCLMMVLSFLVFTGNPWFLGACHAFMFAGVYAGVCPSKW